MPNNIRFEGDNLTPEQIPQATGWHIVIAPIKIEEKTSGGIIITTDDQKMAETTRFVSKVLAVGPLAYKHDKFKAHPDEVNPQPWCGIGDIITTSSYTGSNIPMIDESGSYFLKIINDDEVLTNVTNCTGNLNV